MENSIDFVSIDRSDELITSLTSFVRLYSQRRVRLQRTSQTFALTAAGLDETNKDENQILQTLFAMFGGGLGAACGAVAGGLWGAFGAVAAATYARLCGDINAVGATVGFVGSVFGGAVGGVFGGAVGSTVGAAAEVMGSPVPRVVSEVAWFTIGFVTGGATGGVFGGTVGVAGGGFGGAFGALYSTRFAGSLVRSMVCYFLVRNKEPKEQKNSKKENVIQKAGDFCEAIKPLVEELKTIKTISDNMASSVVVHSVASQTAKTLASVTTMEKSISASQSATDLPQFVSSVEEAARQCKTVTEELETTRAEVDKLLVSLRTN